MIIEYLLFIGLWLYLIAGVMFLFLFLRTLRTKDGIGLLFLRFLTLSISIGAFTIFIIRFLSEYGTLPFLTARAIAIINPIVLVIVALYLNCLFHYKEKDLLSQNTKDIQKINNDTKIIKDDTKQIRENTK